MKMEPAAAFAASPPEAASTAADGGSHTAVMRQFVTFRIAGETFAVDMAAVREIIRLPDVVRVPLAPATLDGLANLRGNVLPIVSLRRLLGLEDRPHDDASRAMVVDVGQPMGFVVDQVSSVISVAPGQIDEGSAAGSSAIASDLLAGMIKDAGNHAVTMVVDFTRLIDREFAHMAQAVREAVSTHDHAASTASGGQAGGGSDEMQLVNFLVDGQEYGIAIADVQEIVHLPETITRLPHAPGHVLGLMTLRQRLLPIVDLRRLFGLSARALDDKTRIVVLNLADMAVGLVVDTVSEVLRVALADVSTLPPMVATRGDLSDISRACQLDGGKRLVAIINSHNLFDLPPIRQALAAAADAEADAVAEQDARQDAGQDMRQKRATGLADNGQLVVFTLNGEEFAVPIASVREIVRLPDQLFRVPKAAHCVEGVINLRGVVLPVMDLRARMGLARAERSDRQRIMVFQIEGQRTGFVVDHVAQVLTVPAHAIEPAPQLSDGQSRLLPRMVNLSADKRMLQLIDPAHLLEAEHLQAISGLAA